MESTTSSVHVEAQNFETEVNINDQPKVEEHVLEDECEHQGNSALYDGTKLFNHSVFLPNFSGLEKAIKVTEEEQKVEGLFENFMKLFEY